MFRFTVSITFHGDALGVRCRNSRTSSPNKAPDMKSSSFAIVIAAFLMAITPVGIFAPKAYVEGWQAFAKLTPLCHATALVWVVMGLLVLVRPADRKSLTERFVRVLACLGLIKSLAMLWVPGFLPTAIGWLTSLPGWALRLGSLCDFSFGLLMLWTARLLIRAESRSEEDSAE